MKNDLEQRYINMIENNVNVGKTNVGIEFISLVAGVVVLCFVIYFCADNISNFFIDRMSTETQLKIEQTISASSSKPCTFKNENEEKIKNLENIRNTIISQDKNLQNKSKFNIYETPNEEVNAFVYPDGSIYVTDGLLNKINDNEMLTFIMAHELGHYVHRDHLKTISRQIIAYTANTIISGGNQTSGTTINNISSLNELKHSRSQEINADKYANKMVYRIYGSNSGAVKFFQYLEKEEKAPEFTQYFSTHPSTKQRLELIKKR